MAQEHAMRLSIDLACSAMPMADQQAMRAKIREIVQEHDQCGAWR
jgi:hypothetical protein